MKTAIIIAAGTKQIVFTPETDDEKQALKLITVKDDIHLAVHSGTFGEANLRPFAVHVQKCEGGYLRAWPDGESVMLVLSPKDESKRITRETMEGFYTIDDMKNCFEQSGLRHPMAGLKYETFDEFIANYKKS